jgi:pimeloyl-ACP methyl ester carboxylesterase
MTPPSIGAGWAAINGANLHYRIAGDGPPLLLLHAGICDSRMWDGQIGEFARTHRVIAPDLRGYGQTRMVAGYAHRDDVGALMDHLGLPHAVLIGVSMSGRTALDFTLEYPDRVDALVLVGSALSGYRFEDPGTLAQDEVVDAAMADGRYQDAAEMEIKLWVAGPRRAVEQIDPKLRDRVRTMLLRTYETPPDLRLERPLEPPAIGRLGEVQKPTLVIVGNEDVPDVLAISDRLAAGIGGARKVVMHGTAHLPNMEDPAAFNRIVRGFLADLPRRS